MNNETIYFVKKNGDKYEAFKTETPCPHCGDPTIYVPAYAFFVCDPCQLVYTHHEIEYLQQKKGTTNETNI